MEEPWASLTVASSRCLAGLREHGELGLHDCLPASQPEDVPSARGDVWKPAQLLAPRMLQCSAVLKSLCHLIIPTGCFLQQKRRVVAGRAAPTLGLKLCAMGLKMVRLALFSSFGCTETED